MQLPIRNVNCAICATIISVVFIFVLVNLFMAQDAKDCLEHQADEEVQAVFLGNGTFKLLDVNMTCAVAHSSAPIGEVLSVYHSKAGECALNKQDDSCYTGLIVFNVMYVLIGVTLTFGCVVNLVKCVEAVKI